MASIHSPAKPNALTQATHASRAVGNHLKIKLDIDRKKLFYWPLTCVLCLTFPILNSCNLDQVETTFSDYETANKKGLFEQGWIPSEIVFQSMTEIYQRTNLDLNTCIFSYKVSSHDQEIFEQRIEPTKTKFIKPKGIKIPKWWINKIEEIDKSVFIINDNSDTVYLLIDKDVNGIYGWRK